VLCDQLTGGIQDCAAGILGFANDGRIAGAEKRILHFLHNTGEARLNDGPVRPSLAVLREAGVTPVNARNVAHERGIEIIESRSTRSRNYTSLLSVKLHTPDGERWVEGAVFERTSPRLVLLDSISVEAPLEGTLIVIRNTDQPGVIGAIGTILGRHNVNIANFALGRQGDSAVGVVIVDTPSVADRVLDEIREVKGVREVRLVRV